MYVKKFQQFLKSFGQYPLYFIIGGLISIFVIIVRECLDRLIPIESTRTYSASVILAYLIGILMSFVLHSRITFYSAQPLTSRQKIKQITSFFSNSLLSLVLTLLVSLVLRKLLLLLPIPGNWGNTLAFGFAALLTSIVTYLINKIIVFRLS